jgi:hypothetical protein
MYTNVSGRSPPDQQHLCNIALLSLAIDVDCVLLFEWLQQHSITLPPSRSPSTSAAAWYLISAKLISCCIYRDRLSCTLVLLFAYVEPCIRLPWRFSASPTVQPSWPHLGRYSLDLVNAAQSEGVLCRKPVLGHGRLSCFDGTYL